MLNFFKGKVNRRLDPLRLEGMNRALIRKLSGDTGSNDISRIPRVPGTYNYKLTNNPREVTVSGVTDQDTIMSGL